MNPSTTEWRLRTCLLQWHTRRITRFNAVDPLTPEERARADAFLEARRGLARAWLRGPKRRALPSNVVAIRK